jgi:hypothetical protein
MVRVVADEVFDHHQIVAVSDPAGVERDASSVLPTPLPEVLHPFEPLTRLGKLQHRIVVVDLMRDVFVHARIVPVALESEHEVFLVEHLLTSRHRWFESPLGGITADVLARNDVTCQWPGAMVARAVTSKRTVAQGRTHQNHPSWLTVQHSQGHAWRGRAKDSAYAKGPLVRQAGPLADVSPPCGPDRLRLASLL